MIDLYAEPEMRPHFGTRPRATISVDGGELPTDGLTSKSGVEDGTAGEASGVDVREGQALRVLVGVGGGRWRRRGRGGDGA